MRPTVRVFTRRKRGKQETSQDSRSPTRVTCVKCFPYRNDVASCLGAIGENLHMLRVAATIANQAQSTADYKLSSRSGALIGGRQHLTAALLYYQMSWKVAQDMTALTDCLERNAETHLEEQSFRNPDWINLSEQMDEWRAIVTIGMNIFFP